MALVLVISSGAVLQTGRSAAEEILDLETDEEDCWQTEQDGEENALEGTQEETETVSDGGGLQIETIEEETESDYPAETEAAGSRDDAPESAQAEPLDDEPAAPKDESGGE